MARITVEDCLEQIDNRFALVLLAAARARQLMRGSKSLVEGHKNNEQVIALREVAAGKVKFDRSVKEALQASLVQLRNQQQQAEKRKNPRAAPLPGQQVSRALNHKTGTADHRI